MNKRAIIITIVVIVIIIAAAIFYPLYHKQQARQDALTQIQNEAEEQVQKNNPELYNKLQQQVKDAEAAIKTDSNDYNAYISLGVAQNALGNYEAAIAAYKKATEIRPVGSIPWNNLAVIYTRLEEYDKAEDAFIQWIKNIPGDTDAYLGLARLYVSEKIGTKQKALETLQEGLKVVADRATLEQAIQRINKGELP